MKYKQIVALVAMVAVAFTGAFLVTRYRRLANEREYQAVGAEWEKAGKLSQTDYLRVHALSDVSLREKPMSEADLNFTLGVLRSKDALVRVRALGLLERAARLGTEDQRSQVALGIEPSLVTTDKLEKLAADRVKMRLAEAKK